MKIFFLIITLLSLNSYGQIVFNFDVNNATSIVNNNTTGYTEVIQNVNGLILTVSSETGDVSISNGKVVATDDWVYFNFNTDVKLIDFGFDTGQSNSLDIKMYDTNGIELPTRVRIGISGAESNLIFNNTINDVY